MALLILHFARRPASCENAGQRFHVPYFRSSRHLYVTPLCSQLLPDILVGQHERETHLQAEYSLQTAVLLVSILLTARQNRAYISDYVLQGIVSYVHSLKGSIA